MTVMTMIQIREAAVVAAETLDVAEAADEVETKTVIGIATAMVVITKRLPGPIVIPDPMIGKMTVQPKIPTAATSVAEGREVAGADEVETKTTTVIAIAMADAAKRRLSPIAILAPTIGKITSTTTILIWIAAMSVAEGREAADANALSASRRIPIGMRKIQAMTI